jgi:biopolymer transport protein ExbD
MFPEGVLIGVLIGVDVVFMVVLDVFMVVLPALFVFSLPQPMPKAATASKVRRAKVLRIELSPVTQRVRSLRS